jgi:hypothetical protein
VSGEAFTDLDDLDTVEAGVLSLFGTLLGFTVQSARRPRTMIVGPSAMIDWLGADGLGVDDVAWEDNDDTAPTAVTATVIGAREETLQVSVWSDDQTPSKTARRYLEQLRTKLRLPSAKETLRALGLATVEIFRAIPLATTEGGRDMAHAVMDVRFAYAVTADDAEIPYIETAVVESEFVPGEDADDVPDFLSYSLDYSEDYA